MKITLIMFLFMTIKVFAADECSKQAAEKFVQDTCTKIEAAADEKSAKSGWPQSLLFKNCGDNYIWVQETSNEIKMIMHPIKQNLNGQSLVSQKDENNFPLFVEFDKAAKKNPSGAWVEYLWPKPNAKKATPKISYVKKCKLKNGSEWIAGSGLWKEDLK